MKYWVNVSESCSARSPELSRINVVVLTGVVVPVQ